MTAARIERSFAGAILCVITVILILFTFNNNKWVTVLSDHPQISPPWWWDNHKMRARKTLLIVYNQLKTFATGDRSIKSDQSASRTYNHRGSAEPRQLIGVLRWCYASWLELGSILRSTLNLVQLNRDLIDVGETRPKTLRRNVFEI